MTVPTDTERVVTWFREHPGSSVMEVRFGTYISNVTARMSDAREAGVEFAKWRDDHGVYRYRVIEPEPEPVQVALFFSEAS